MNGMMTIQLFSEKTGLPSSTLRYYEKERLILPDVRGENGYQLYQKDQISKAVLIHSLRQAGIPLAEIRQYLSAEGSAKADWMTKWRKDIDAKMENLNVAKQFLYGIEPEDEHIRLSKWDESTRIIWFRHEVRREHNSFADVIRQRAAFLQIHTGIFSSEAYILKERIVEETMVGKVGFRISGKVQIVGEWLREAEIKVIEPTLFVTLDCLSDDDYVCFNLMLLLQKFGFEPEGPSLERYHLDDMTRYQLMIPVLHV